MVTTTMGEWKNTMGHNELAADLALHLRQGSSRVTWQDMQLGPSGSPRPDVYTMEPTYTRLSFEAFEVKVSRSDFRSDVTSGKWQSYLKYAQCVTFAVPADIGITKADVPGVCGLIVRHEKVWRYAKKPVRNVLTDIPWEAWVKLLLDGIERADRVGRQRGFNEWLAAKKLGARWGEKAAELIRKINDLPRAMEYERDQLVHMIEREEKELARLKDATDRERDRVRRSLSDELLKLGRHFGLQDGATENDLVAAIGAVNRALGIGTNSWGERVANPFSDAVGRLRHSLQLVEDAEKIIAGIGHDGRRVHGVGGDAELCDMPASGVGALAGGVASPEDRGGCGEQGAGQGCDTPVPGAPPACGGDTPPGDQGVDQGIPGDGGRSNGGDEEASAACALA